MNIEEAYNQWSSQYDSNLNRTRDMDKMSTISILSNYAFDKVLELGCGTGKNTQWLMTRAKQVVALDFSEEMLKIARSKIRESNVEFLRCDLLEEWEVEDNSFDLVSANLVLEHIKDIELVFRKANNKLKKDGLFFISELHPFKQYLGSGARFDDQNETIRLEVFVHHLSEFMEAAIHNDFELIEFKEWFDEDGETKLPRLISFVFRK